MAHRENKDTTGKHAHREFPFIPRVINPIKIKEVIIFSADEEIRKSQGIIRAEMPWAQVRVLSNPQMASDIRSNDATVMIMDDTAMNLIDTSEIRQNNSNIVIVLLSFHRLVQCSPPSIAEKEFPYTAKADLIFAVDRNEFTADRIITSVVRAAEDHLNIETGSGIRRFILLIVDDEPSWPSQFLPLLYEIIGQRADVKITRTYEEAMRFLFGVENEEAIGGNHGESGNGDQVVCLITDIFFPKGENINGEAGKVLISLVNKYYARIPIIIASKAAEAAELSGAGFILPKGDPGSLETLKRYIRDYTGIGDFVIHDEGGKELYRLKDLREMYSLFMKANDENSDAERLRLIIEKYGQKDMFSTWFYMHSFRELGDRLRPQKMKGKRMVTVMKRLLKREILRMSQTPLIIDGIKAFDLIDLLHMLSVIGPEKIQSLSDNDIISSWLDHTGYSELAEELRPIHGTGNELRDAIARIIENWIKEYPQKSVDSPEQPGSI
jgi:hypothetical protein